MNHADLCSLSVKWLKRPASQGGPGCNIAFSECTGSYSGEIVDAIGFRNVGEDQYSVVVEAKLTRADFLADAAKPHRNGSVVGMGVFRYFLAPAGLIAIDEVPTGWGLIEVSVRGVLTVRSGHVLEKRQKDLGRKDFSKWTHSHNAERETALLVRLLARIGDADELHRTLKTARNDLAQAHRTIDQLQAELKSSFTQYWELREQLDGDTGAGSRKATARTPTAVKSPVALEASEAAPIISTN